MKTNTSMMTKEEYNKFCADSENMKVYDGRGTYDIYECENGHRLITTYGAKGVTPFTIKCPMCGKMMIHTTTLKSAPINGTEVVKWIRPTYEQYCRMPKGLREHINNGGLIMETEINNY